MAADNKTQLAQLGTENRINVPMEVIPEQIRNALIAGEDKEFYQHHGISYSGILRAAWNNLTSSDTQGASTITQQYVKLATDQSQITYARKLREAVLARKLEDKYSKLQIMGFYLNTVDFGRGAIGVEKAALAYFNKSAKDLTVPEAAVLGSVIKDPYAGNGALSLYDPEAHPDSAQTRWDYVLSNMVEKGWLGQTDKDAMKLPMPRPSKGIVTTAEWGIKVNPGSPAGTATGNVVNYVYSELKEQGIESKELKTGGYRVTTTIDPKAQKIAESAARPDLKGSELEGRKIVMDKTGKKVVQDLESGVVMIDPAPGRVIAYYGGLDGTGIDYSGVNTGANGPYGGHEPGSSMKLYTLAAALDAGASLQSRWRAMPFTTEAPERLKVGNAGAANTSCKDYCTLEYSLMKSYNVPFYWVARQIGPGKVVKMAHAAGVNTMWDNQGGAHNLSESVQDDMARSPFDRQVGFGQYGITVLDHASGTATFANGGVYNKPHFVLKVEKKDPVTGQYKTVTGKGEKLKPVQAIRRQVANDVTYAMHKVFHDHSGWAAAQDNRDVASKTGTWEGSVLKNGKPTPSSDNSHAWVIGFTKQVALAVWTGNAASQNPVVDPKTHSTINSGSTPYRIWRDVLSDYSKGLPKQKLADPSNIGDDDFSGANGISPSPIQPVQPSQGECIPLINCPSESPQNPGGGGPGQQSPSPRPSTSRSKGIGQ
jgi:membrane peptidoglycan carboxypeptidase